MNISGTSNSNNTQQLYLFVASGNRVAGLNCFPYRYSNVVTDGNVIKHDASIDEDSAVEVFHLTCYFLLICDACVL